MRQEDVYELFKLLKELIAVLKPEAETLPTLEEAVEAKVKNIYLDRGINQVFDKLDEHDSVRNLINRKTSEVAARTLDAIEKTVGDPEYKAQRQKEVEGAVKKALEEKEQLEAKNE